MNSDGEVQLKGSSSIPTPIGVLTWKVYIEEDYNDPTLTIIHGEKIYVYDLGDEAYYFEFPNYSGKVEVIYDGKGNVTIRLE